MDSEQDHEHILGQGLGFSSLGARSQSVFQMVIAHVHAHACALTLPLPGTAARPAAAAEPGSDGTSLPAVLRQLRLVQFWCSGFACPLPQVPRTGPQEGGH